MVGKLKAGVWTGLGWEVEFVIQEVEVLPAQWGGHSTPNHEKDQMVGCSGEEGTLTAVGNLAPNSFHFFNHLNRQSKSSLHQHQGLLTNRWHCPLLPSKGCVRTSCSSSILFFLPARSLVQSMSEHQEYSKFIHSLGFCWCSKPPESGERHLKKLAHGIQTSSALSWLEPNPDLFRGVKTHSHVGLRSFPRPLSPLVLASTTQKSFDMSHLQGILSSAKNKRDWKFRETGYS